MLEFFRRHRGAFLMTLTVIIILSFSVWGGWRTGRGSGFASATDSAFSFNGKEYTIAEMQRLERYLQVMYMLQLFDAVQSLSQISSGSPDNRRLDFVINLLVLRDQMQKLGVQPSDAEARDALEKTPALQENGKFSPQRAYMAEQNLASMGFNGNDMLEIMKLSLGLKKLQDLVAGNYLPSPLEAEQSYSSRNHTAKISTIPFNDDDFKKTVTVSDEDVKKYFEENKDSYKTPELRAVSYILFEEPKELDKKTLEESQKLQKEVVERVNKFNEESMKPGAVFDKVAEALKEKVLKQDLFSQDKAPEMLADEGDVVAAMFQFKNGSQSISDPVKGKKGYYIFTITKTEDPKPQDLPAVKDRIKETLTGQRAQEALSKAVNEARTALMDGLKAGKKIEDLAKEKKLALTGPVDLTISEPPQDLPNAYQIAREVETTAAGQITKAVNTDKGVMLVFVHAKELRKRDNSAALRKNVEDSTARMQRMRIFSAWFNRVREDAEVKILTTLA